MVSLASMPVFSGSTVNNSINTSELNQRVAVIKRFKELLSAQRDRFRAYLESLDKQADTIQNGSAEDLMHYVELEEKIVRDIFSIQKVIDPLENMYHGVKKDISVAEGNEVSGLKEALNELKTEAITRSERNKELLSRRMTSLRSEIKSLRNNPYAKRRFNSDPAPSIIDLKG